MNASDFSPFLNIPGMFRIEVLVTKKVDIKMGVHDHSLKMVRNAFEETNVPSKVRGKLIDVWITDKDV
jgi:hypothetical protein